MSTGRETGLREAQRTDEKDVSGEDRWEAQGALVSPSGAGSVLGWRGGGSFLTQSLRSRALLPSLPPHPTSLLLHSISPSLSFYTSPFPSSQRRARRFRLLPGWGSCRDSDKDLVSDNYSSVVMWVESLLGGKSGLIENLAMPTVVRKLWKSRGLPGPR